MKATRIFCRRPFHRRAETMGRKAEIERITKETTVRLTIELDGEGRTDISTGIPFFDHMLTLGGRARVLRHHAAGQGGSRGGLAPHGGRRRHRAGGRRLFGPRRPQGDPPVRACRDPDGRSAGGSHIGSLAASVSRLRPAGGRHRRTSLNRVLVKEFFKSVANHGGLNLHVTVLYGENGHHVIEAVFKSFGGRCDKPWTSTLVPLEAFAPPRVPCSFGFRGDATPCGSFRQST